MYAAIPGGSYEDIQTLKLQEAPLRCWVPPPPTDDKLIMFSDEPTSEQYWRRSGLPDWYHELRKYELTRQLTDAKYVEKKLQLYRNQEWTRRLNGVHILINGKLTYLTGPNYYYLEWWHGDHDDNDGYPIYYDEMRKRFYFRQYCLEDDKCLGYIILGPRGFGKELADYEKVKTPKGEIPIGEIKPGQIVYGKNGKEANVTAVYPQGVKDIYRMVLADGRFIDCGLDHQWGVYDLSNKYKVLTTRQILEKYKYKHSRSGFTYIYCIPINEPVVYEEKPLRVDPYIMGYMLGNGICNKSTPAVCTIDDEVLNEFKKKLPNYEFNSDKTCSQKYSIKYIGSDKYSNRYNNSSFGTNPLYREICSYGVNKTCKDKFIPDEYKFSSIEQRMELVRGLMDSDGSVNSEGSVEFCSANERLLDDVVHVIRSLGIRCQKGTECRAGQEILYPQGTTGVRGIMYRLFIRTDQPIFKLSRKLLRLKKLKRRHVVSIVDIKHIGTHSATCISVDSEDNLFLTKDFIVTHNTQEETSTIVESISKPPRKKQGVLQSKSEQDAKDVFIKKIRPAYNDLPDFFKPISNHGTIPDRMLSFYRDLVRGKGAKNVSFDVNEELQNTLTYAAAKEKQLSGQNIKELFNDEIGVTDPKKEANVKTRMEVNRFCVYRNHKKVGLIRATSTVEEIDKGGAECKEIWDESDIKDRDGNGYTKSGLYRFVVNDLDTTIQFADKYGNINKDQAKQFHDNARAGANNHVARSSYIRKYPRDESELFIKAADKCHYDAMILTDRMSAINHMENKPYRQGLFEWENNVKNTRVLWRPCAHDPESFVLDKKVNERFCPVCKFHINKEVFPDEKDRNNVKSELYGNLTLFTPGNQLKYTAGADPYENSFVVGIGSKAGFHIKRKYDYLIDDPKEPAFKHVTNSPALEYIHRASDVFEMYDDMIMAAWFFGCEILPEANKIGLQRFLEEYYPNFLIKRPKKLTIGDVEMKVDNGLRSSTPIISAYVDATEYDVRHNGHKYPFPRTIAQLIDFDASETTKYDGAVSWGFTLLGEQKKIEENEPIPVNMKLFRQYDQYGRETEG